MTDKVVIPFEFKLHVNYKGIPVYACHLEHNNNVYAFCVNDMWYFRTIWQDVRIKINFELQKADDFKKVIQ